jgi:DNA-binding MarR family transcriptional regulator
MALLLEIGPSRPERLAKELGWTVGRCGRELVVLEARGYIARTEEGVRALTPAGSSLLATLF